MAEIYIQDATVIAKELTLAVMEGKNVYSPDPLTPENSGDHYGKLYKKILKNVREAMNEAKYD